MNDSNNTNKYQDQLGVQQEPRSQEQANSMAMMNLKNSCSSHRKEMNKSPGDTISTATVVL